MSNDTRCIGNTLYHIYYPPHSNKPVFYADGGIEGHILALDTSMIPAEEMAVLVLWATELNNSKPKTPHLDFNRR